MRGGRARAGNCREPHCGRAPAARISDRRPGLSGRPGVRGDPVLQPAARGPRPARRRPRATSRRGHRNPRQARNRPGSRRPRQARSPREGARTAASGPPSGSPPLPRSPPRARGRRVPVSRGYRGEHGERPVRRVACVASGPPGHPPGGDAEHRHGYADREDQPQHPELVQAERDQRVSEPGGVQQAAPRWWPTAAATGPAPGPR